MPTLPLDLRDSLRWLNRRRSLVTLVEGWRQLLPGDGHFGDPMSTTGTSPAHVLGRQAWSLSGGRLSLVGELALAGLQVADWLGEDVRGVAAQEEMPIMFADLRGFSEWALTSGNEEAAELLRTADATITGIVESRDGVVVKRLGDGTMSIFADCPAAVDAAFEAIAEVGEIDVDGYVAELRAGLHVGSPMRIGTDYVGVDVNIAARLCEAAPGGTVLMSDAVRERLDGGIPEARRASARLRGVPPEISIFKAEPH